MEYIVELFNHLFYFWLGKKVFGENFVEIRITIPFWKRFLLGSVSALIAFSIVIAIYFLFQYGLRVFKSL